MKAMKDSTRLIIFSSVFCALTLVFFLLFQFEVISNLDFYAAMVYITYFAGLALYYNSQLLKTNNKLKSSKICLICSIILILVSLVALIYGFATGNLAFWIW